MFTSGESTGIYLLSLAALLQLLSGLPLLFRSNAACQRLCAASMLAASCSGVAGGLAALLSARSATYLIASVLPFGPVEIAVDPLSALFLLPMFIVTGCSALYGIGYWPAARHPKTVRKLSVSLGILAAAMTLLLMAKNTVLFLFAWEVMAIAAYFALTTEDDKPEVRDAGTLYLITTHLGTLALFAMFSLLRSAGGDYLFPAAGTLSAQNSVATGIFLTCLLGFGMKAGVMPLHVWLPSAHANAPSHISAVLSGIVLKTGIYGMLRVFSAFHDIPGWWGAAVLLFGGVSAVVGVAFAIGQHDLKRLLAYHSIENIGIIMMGIGVALIGESEGNSTLLVLGLAGALLHVFNHATFKALLFLAAGSVIHAVGTREIDQMGGVGRRLPVSTALFLVGAVAICGLPPLNGFVSELLVYLGFFSAIRSFHGVVGALPALGAPALALVGGLAVACFVKVFGVAFLGLPRSERHREGGEAPGSMLVPMAALAGICVLIGLAPLLVAVPLDHAIAGYRGIRMEGIESLAPLPFLSLLDAALVSVALFGVLLMFRRLRPLPLAHSVTWGCGYLAPTPRMQYSSSSFGSMLVQFFRHALQPVSHASPPMGLFPAPGRFRSHVPETVLERIYLPFLEYLYRKTAPIRGLQHGKLNIYIFYTFATLLLLMILTTR